MLPRADQPGVQPVCLPPVPGPFLTRPVLSRRLLQGPLRQPPAVGWVATSLVLQCSLLTCVLLPPARPGGPGLVRCPPSRSGTSCLHHSEGHLRLPALGHWSVRLL